MHANHMHARKHACIPSYPPLAPPRPLPTGWLRPLSGMHAISSALPTRPFAFLPTPCLARPVPPHPLALSLSLLLRPPTPCAPPRPARLRWADAGDHDDGDVYGDDDEDGDGEVDDDDDGDGDDGGDDENGNDDGGDDYGDCTLMMVMMMGMVMGR